MSIYHDPRNLSDLFTIADQIDQKSQTVFLKVLVKPLVRSSLGRRLCSSSGSLVAMWPDAVEAAACRPVRGGRRQGMNIALAIAAVLAVAAVVFVARPFIREPAPRATAGRARRARAPAAPSWRGT